MWSSRADYNPLTPRRVLWVRLPPPPHPSHHVIPLVRPDREINHRIFLPPFGTILAYPRKRVRAMEKLSTLAITGKSGKQYDFDVYPWGTEFNPLGAVYVITKRIVKDGKGRHTYIYIGQTADLSERFDDHHKADCFSQNEANCICVHLQSNEKSRLAIESDLIDGHDTPCNG